MAVLAGKVAIVTGGGRGVGRGIALALAAEGARVALCARNFNRLQNVAAEIRERGGVADVYVLDIQDRALATKVVDEVASTSGSIDILVNNAYRGRNGLLNEISDEDFLLSLDAGIVGTFRMMRLCYPHLKKAKGSIINLSAGASRDPEPGLGAYAAAKAGLNLLSQTAAIEWAKDGIRVNMISPLAWTEAVHSWVKANPDKVGSMTKGVMLERLGDPEKDIGRAAVYLSSPDASFITSMTMCVDGGQTCLR